MSRIKGIRERDVDLGLFPTPKTSPPVPIPKVTTSAPPVKQPTKSSLPPIRPDPKSSIPTDPKSSIPIPIPIPKSTPKSTPKPIIPAPTLNFNPTLSPSTSFAIVTRTASQSTVTPDATTITSTIHGLAAQKTDAVDENQGIVKTPAVVFGTMIVLVIIGGFITLFVLKKISRNKKKKALSIQRKNRINSRQTDSIMEASGFSEGRRTIVHSFHQTDPGGERISVRGTDFITELRPPRNALPRRGLYPQPQQPPTFMHRSPSHDANYYQRYSQIISPPATYNNSPAHNRQ